MGERWRLCRVECAMTCSPPSYHSSQGSRTPLGGLKDRRPHRKPSEPFFPSGPGGARILVCGASNRRYSVSATSPKQKGQASPCDTWPYELPLSREAGCHKRKG